MPLSREETRRLEIVLRAYLDDVATVRITEEAAYGSGTGATPTSHLHARNRVQDPTARTAADWLQDWDYQAARWRVAWIQHAYQGLATPPARARWMQDIIHYTFWEGNQGYPPARVARLLHISEIWYYKVRRKAYEAIARTLPPEWRDPLAWGDRDPDHPVSAERWPDAPPESV